MKGGKSLDARVKEGMTPTLCGGRRGGASADPNGGTTPLRVRGLVSGEGYMS